ncbi:ArsR family transcriptional regulator [Vibrio cholerae]|nr:ArsR family transcriptional regulator [Vibrio cholerae]EGQ7979969.1 ArsR family transcriptional regulator [Vibrio cholerae]EGQ8528450.1 ArsR family transcriptional regulator [Vibrio cholerae]
MSFKELLTEDQRLVVLRSLHEMHGYEANESIIDSCLDAYGHKISRDVVRTHLFWLQEQGLVSLRDVGDCQIARLTGRGEDVATGQAVVPGVKRPRA